ncbi:MAG: flagellar biosynthetic protein FliO [Lachnospiraceae bacterium]|nr:flagellar biosynthetic protein FliO [Lachnospiraceae bacterium]
MPVILAAGGESIAQLFTVIIIFVLVLVITVFTTRFIGSYEKNRFSGSNIEIIEAQRLMQNRYIMVVRVADKYFAIAVGKNEITYLTELHPDDIKPVGVNEGLNNQQFKEVFENVKQQLKQKVTPKK